MICTTLQNIKLAHPCGRGWRTLLSSLDDNFSMCDKVSFQHIVNSNGIVDALWCCKVEPKYNEIWDKFCIFMLRDIEEYIKDETVIPIYNSILEGRDWLGSRMSRPQFNFLCQELCLNGLNDEYHAVKAVVMFTTGQQDKVFRIFDYVISALLVKYRSIEEFYTAHKDEQIRLTEKYKTEFIRLITEYDGI